jgi:hypothetical protein
VVCAEISGKPGEGRVGGGERKNISAIPLARVFTIAANEIKNNSG